MSHAFVFYYPWVNLRAHHPPLAHLSEVAEMGDIEKFFNDNFFKKVSSDHAGDDMQIKRDFEEDKKEFMHGVPESAYEPTLMEEMPNDNQKQHLNYRANDPFRAVVSEGPSCTLSSLLEHLILACTMSQ